MTQPDGSPIPSGFGINVQPAPILEIATADKKLNGAVMNVMWSCRSTFSKLNNGFPASVTTTSRVTYVDECLTAALYPPTT